MTDTTIYTDLAAESELADEAEPVRDPASEPASYSTTAHLLSPGDIAIGWDSRTSATGWHEVAHVEPITHRASRDAGKVLILWRGGNTFTCPPGHQFAVAGPEVAAQWRAEVERQDRRHAAVEGLQRLANLIASDVLPVPLRGVLSVTGWLETAADVETAALALEGTIARRADAAQLRVRVAGVDVDLWSDGDGQS